MEVIKNLLKKEKDNEKACDLLKKISILENHIANLSTGKTYERKKNFEKKLT